MSTKDIFIEILEGRIRDLNEAGKALVDAIERYARQDCLRSELLNKTAEFKKLLK